MDLPEELFFCLLQQLGLGVDFRTWFYVHVPRGAAWPQELRSVDVARRRAPVVAVSVVEEDHLARHRLRRVRQRARLRHAALPLVAAERGRLVDEGRPEVRGHVVNQDERRRQRLQIVWGRRDDLRIDSYIRLSRRFDTFCY